MISPNYEGEIMQVGRPVEILSNDQLSRKIAGYKFLDQFSNLWWIKITLDHAGNEQVKSINIFSEYCIKDTGGVFYELKKYLIHLCVDRGWVDDLVELEYNFTAIVKGFEEVEMTRDDVKGIFYWVAFSILDSGLSDLSIQSFEDLYDVLCPCEYLEKDLKKFTKSL